MPYRLRLRLLDEAEHEAFLAAMPSASFLQTPGWAAVKSDWRSERLGWLDGDTLVGDPGPVEHRSLRDVRQRAR